MDFSYSPPSLGGEGISRAGAVKEQAKLSARLGEQGFAGYSQHPPRARTLALVSLSCLGLCGQCGSGWPDGSSEHLPGAFQQHKEQQQRLGGQGSLKRESNGGEEWEGGRDSRGSTQPQLIYSPKRRKGRRGWTGGWIGMPVEEKEKKDFFFTVAEQ